MIHFSEHPQAVIKNGRVEDIIVFADHNAALIQHVANELGADLFVSCCDIGVIPPRYSAWDGEKFTDPTNEYLISIGVLNLDPTIAV